MSLEARIAELNDLLKMQIQVQSDLLKAMSGQGQVATSKPAAVKETNPAATKTEPAKAANPVAEVIAEAEAPASTVTLDDVKAVTIALGNANKRDAIAKLLEGYGAARATLIPEQFWAEYVEAAKAALGD